jgi:hypothetical protein
MQKLLFNLERLHEQAYFGHTLAQKTLKPKTLAL